MPARRGKKLKISECHVCRACRGKLSKVSWYSKARKTVLFFPSPKLSNEMWGFGRQDEGQDSINLYLFGLGFCSWWSFWLKSDALPSPFCPHTPAGMACVYLAWSKQANTASFLVRSSVDTPYTCILGRILEDAMWSCWAGHDRGHLERRSEGLVQTP